MAGIMLLYGRHHAVAWQASCCCMAGIMAALRNELVELVGRQTSQIRDVAMSQVVFVAYVVMAYVVTAYCGICSYDPCSYGLCT